MTYDQPPGGQPWPQQGQPYNPYPQQHQYPPPGYAPQPPYPPGYPPPVGPRRSWPRRHKILTTILGVFGFFVVLGVIGAIAGSGNHTVTTGQAGSTPSSTPSSTPV